MLPIGVLCAGLAVGIVSYMKKGQAPEEPQQEAPLALESRDSREKELRREVEERRARAAERARRQAEEAQQDARGAGSADEEPSPQPEVVSDEMIIDEITPTDTEEEVPVIEEPVMEEEHEAEEGEWSGEPEPPEPPALAMHKPVKEAAQPAPPEEPVEIPAENPFSGEFTLLGGNSNSPAMQKLWIEWVKRMINEAQAPAFVQAMEQRIKACAPQLLSGSKLNYGQYRSSRSMVQTVEFCYLAKIVGLKTLNKLISKKIGEDNPLTSGSTFMLWMLLDKSRPLHNFLQTYKLNSGDADSMRYSLLTFYELWKRTPPKERSRYLNLAIACSLLREDIANSPGLIRVRTEPLLNIGQVYDYFRERDKKRQLLTDVKRLSASNLLYLVDVRLPKSEFDWVYKKLNFPRDKWGQTYSSIEYIMERATQNKDPYEKYTFEEILKEGGVCRDQAYYAATTAKCKGIPSVYITGDGDRGPHAWVGLLTSDKIWTQTGSYGYSSGRFTNPCSGRMLHESMLLNQDKKLTDDKLEPAADCMLLSDYLMRLGCHDQALGAARYVTIAFPILTAGWTNYIDVLSVYQQGDEKPDLSPWKRLRIELERNGKKNTELLDLAQEIEATRITGNMNKAAKMATLKRSSRKLQQYVSLGRTDLLVDSIERQARIYVESKDYRGMALYMKQQLKEYSSRSDVFQLVLHLYFRLLDETSSPQQDAAQSNSKAEYDRKNRWKTCAKEADALFSKQAYTSTDFFAIKKNVAVMKLIAEAYRRGGDERRASKLEREADEKLEESISRASEL